MIARHALEATAVIALASLLAAGTCGATSAIDPPPSVERPPRSDPADHWAFRPIHAPAPPPVRRTSWPITDIDRFVLAALEARDLEPSPPASRVELLRRTSFDVVGLPPTAEEAWEYLANDDDPDRAYEAWIDRLLASPHYAERWARWWLDVARYADTNGQDENKVMANAWRYRDWVIRAFRDNLPFDQFVLHQIAGDLLPSSSSDSESRNFDALVATGFLVLGPKMLAEQDKPKLAMDIVDEQIDTVGRAFLGLTLGCARCHDHKFDPVPSRDYYALAGIFKSTRSMENLAFVSKFNECRISPRSVGEAYDAHRRYLDGLNQRITALRRDADAALKAAGKTELPEDPRPLYPEDVRARLVELECERHAGTAATPPAPDLALAVAEDRPVDLPVHLRGNHLNLAKDPVPRGTLQALAHAHPSPAIPADRSGRLEFARWLVAPSNPLTPRVVVNRIWQGHFGEGLVRTPDNFGYRGETPSHPELLDWLANDFVRSGWDVKRLHRLILRSAVYRQSTRRATPAAGDRGSSEPEIARSAASVDPENRWLSSFPRRRLDAEMIRDGILRASGRLDPTVGGTLVAWKNDEYAPADDVSARSSRRTVYLPVVRDRVYDALTLFDFANPGVTTAKRVPTVVSQQALFFMNSPLVRDSAAHLARALAAAPGRDDTDRIREAYLRILGRPATSSEVDKARHLIERLVVRPDPARTEAAEASSKAPVAADALASLCQALFASNEFIYLP